MACTNSYKIKHGYLLIQLTKFAKGLSQILWKMESRVLSRVSTEPKMEQLFITEVEENHYFYFCLYGLMTSWKQAPGKHYLKKLFIFANFCTGKKLMLILGCWSNSSNLLTSLYNLWGDISIGRCREVYYLSKKISKLHHH